MVVSSEAEEDDMLESNDDFFTGRERDSVPFDVDGPRPNENCLWSSYGLGLETGDSVSIVPTRNMFLGSFDGAFSPAECEDVAIRV